MRFVFDAGAWNPRDGAIIPEIIKQGADAATETVLNGVSAVLLNWIHAGGQWLVVNGIPLSIEVSLIWGMACLLIGCTGSGKWVERGVKAMLISIMLGVARYAI